MKCPSCSAELSQIKVSGISIDLCDRGCGGIWFDERELQHFDEQHEFDVEKLLFPQTKSRPAVSGLRSCPRCMEGPLAILKFGTKSSVEIDQCFLCGGIWLDSGELTAIRKQYPTAAERQKAGDEFLKQVQEVTMSALEREKRERQRDLVLEEKNLGILRKVILYVTRGISK